MERRAPGASGRRPLADRLRPNSSKPNQIQTKPDQENGLGFSWIPSSDSRLFNGLRAVQIKKTPQMESRRRPAASVASSAVTGETRAVQDIGASNLAFHLRSRNSAPFPSGFLPVWNKDRTFLRACQEIVRLSDGLSERLSGI